jgi:hypothetical protein
VVVCKQVVVVVELEDANILVVIVIIVVVARVKCTVMAVNVLAYALADASLLPALAALVKDSAALNDAMLAVVGAR